MTDFADPSDIEAIWRPLTQPEQVAAVTLLGYASGKIRQDVPSVDAWLAGGSLQASSARYVATQMVYRFMLNPGGQRQGSVSIDDYTKTWTLDNVLAAGGLVLSDDLLAWLRPIDAAPAGAFTIRPGGRVC